MTDNLIFLSEWMGVIAVTLLLTMNRRFTARPVAFKYQRREVILSSILAVLLIAASVYTNLRLQLPTLPYDAAPVPGQFLWALIILLPVALMLLIRRQPLLSVGLSRPSTRLGLILGAGPGVQHDHPARQSLQPAGRHHNGGVRPPVAQPGAGAGR